MAKARPRLTGTLVTLLAAVLLPHAAPATADAGRKACAQEARRLCPAEMKSLSRRKVEACMIARIDQTSPACHAAMLQIKGEREAMRGARLTPR